MERGLVIPEDKHKYQHEKTDFRFIKITIKGDHLSLALTSAPLCSSRRQASGIHRLLFDAKSCSGVHSYLKTSKKINMRKKSVNENNNVG
jgi:hypothetical protein